MKLYKHKGFIQKIIISLITIMFLFNFIMPSCMIVSKAALTENYKELDGQVTNGDNFDSLVSRYGINKKFSSFDFDLQNPQTFTEITADGQNKITFSIKKQNLGYANYANYIISITKTEKITSENENDPSKVNGDEATGEETFNKKLEEMGISKKVSDIKFTGVEGNSNKFDAIVTDKNGNNYRVVKTIVDNKGTVKYTITSYDGDTKDVDGDSMTNGKYDNKDEEDDDIGGFLLSPFVAFVNAIADSISTGLQWFMIGDNTSVMRTEDNAQDATGEEANITIEKTYNVGTLFPNFQFSAEEIFANKVPMLNVNFLNPHANFENNTELNKSNIAYQLQGVIRAWYRALRMIAIVGLLSVLIYIGIRIMIDSNTSNKAKYKEKLIDWVVALVILFTMHYIMSFTLSAANELTGLFTSTGDTQNVVVDYNGQKTFRTNLIGLARFQVQDDNMLRKISYEIVYIALLTFTVKFTIVYFKRVINMAFLTLISPLVALMYPVQDGKSQAFGMWLREYIFNALLQPMHFLLYTVLVTSAINLAAKNPLYAIVALMFMTQAEKFLKTIFGFDKAKEGMLGGMSAFASGAIASNLISSFKKGGFLSGDKSGKGGNAPIDVSKNKPAPTIKDADYGNLDQDSLGEEGINPALFTGNPDDDKPTIPNGKGEPRENLPKFGEGNKPKPKGNELPKGNDNKNQPLPPMTRQARDLADSIRANREEEMKKRRIAGIKNIGKRALKPVWDMDKTAGYNLKSIGKGLGKAYLKAGMATAAAAAQMGMSITDGKFSPLESVMTGAAAAKIGDKVWDSGESKLNDLQNAYLSGAYGSDEAALERYNKAWRNDENVNRNYLNKYGEYAKENMRLAEEELNSRGFTDFGDQKQIFSYAESIQDEKYNDWVENEKAYIQQEHSDYSEAQVNAAFEARKAEQAAEIRRKLGSAGKNMSDEEAIKNTIKRQAVQEGARVLKLRNQAEKKNALINPENKAAYMAQQAKGRASAIQKQNKDISYEDAYKQALDEVQNSFNKIDRFDAVNKQ